MQIDRCMWCIHTYYVHMFSLDFFPEISLQPSGFDQNTVGQRQDVICSISVPPDVDPDTIELGWIYKDDIITDGSRVTIDASRYYFNENTLVTIIKFLLLFEKDEGEYFCYAILNGLFVMESTIMQNFKSKPHIFCILNEVGIKKLYL